MKKQPDKPSKVNKKAATSSIRLALENRLLFDGAVVAVATEVAVDKTVAEEKTLESPQKSGAYSDSFFPFSSTPTAFTEDGDSKNHEAQPLAITAAISVSSAHTPSLIIVDSRAEVVSQLLASPPINAEIKVLDANRDGYQQIAEILQDRNDTTKLHLISANFHGQHWLGASSIRTTLNFSDVESLSDWGDNLADNANIVFHSPQKLEGSRWLTQVQALTGARASWSQNDLAEVNKTNANEAILVPKDTPTNTPEDNLLTAPSVKGSQANELVFIDTAVADYQSLLAGIKPDATVILLDSKTDEVQQIAQVVSQYNNIDAIHIISHGSAGRLNLGSSVLNLSTMQGQYTDELALIGQHLSANADILVYGCNFGQGEIGLHASTELAVRTGADVADSTDGTGSAALSGDWVLERKIGVIETDAFIIDAYSGILSQNNTASWSGVTGASVANQATSATATSTVAGVTTTVGFSSFSNGTTSVNTFSGSTILNNIAAFNPAVQGTGSLQMQFNWDTNPEGQTTEASIDGGNAVITISFSQAVKDPILHLDRLGGSDGSKQNGMSFSLLTSGITLNRLSGSSHFQVSGGVIQNNQIDTTHSVPFGGGTMSAAGGESSMTATAGTSAGSVQLQGTFTTLSFLMSAAANSNEGLGSDAFEMKVTFDPAPVANNDVASTNEDTTLAGNLYANNGSGTDSDANNDTLTISQINGANYVVNSPIPLTHGKLTITNATTGAFAFAPFVDYNGTDSFNYIITDANGGTSSATATITIAAVNDAPVLYLDGNNSSGATGTNYTTSYTENAPGTPIADTDISVTDIDNANITSATITITNKYSGDLLAALSSLPIGITASSYSSSTGVLTLSGSSSLANYQTAIRNIGFSSSSENPNTTARSITVVLNDGAANSNTATTTVNVTAVNDAPTVTIAAPLTGTEDTALILNGITLADPDSASNSVNVTISIPSGAGVLNWAGYSGVGLVSSTATSLTLSGGRGNIQGAIDNGRITFVPDQDFNTSITGALTLSVSFNDNGNNGTGGAHTANGSTTFTVSAAADATNDAIATNEDTAKSFNVLTGTNGATADYFENIGRVVTSVTQGSNGSVSFVADGTINYTPNANFSGVDTFTYTIVSGGVTETATVTMTVNGVNDVPVLTGDLSATVAESGTYEITVADLGFTDSDNVAAEETFTVSGHTNGIVLVNGAAATSFTGSQLVAGLVSFRHDGGETSTASFLVNVEDGNQDGSAPVNGTFNFTVTPANDPPFGSNKTITIQEDNFYILKVADFGFSDPNDSPSNNFANIIVTGLPPLSEGVYRLNGAAVTVGDVINVSDISLGLLVFTPALNVNNATAGGDFGALGFQVQDDGGTLNGGIDTDPTPNTLDFNITPVGDLITIGDLNDGTVGNTDAQVKESDLTGGTHASGNGENTAGTFTISPSSSLVSLTINAQSFTKAQFSASGTTPISVTGAHGDLTITGYNTVTGVVSYRYTLTSPANHSGGIVNDSFSITSTDVDGGNESGQLAINIVDDMPVIIADVDEAINFAGSPDSTASGNVVTGIGGVDPNNADGNADQVGADTNVSPITGVVAGTGPVATGVGVGGAVVGVNGYGSLTLNNNGSYAYTPNYLNATVAALMPGQTVTDTYTYEIIDGDGNIATTTLTITIVGVPNVVGLNDGGEVGTDGSVLESDLVAGTNAVGNGEVLNGSFQLVSPTNGVTSVTIDGIIITQAELLDLATTNKTFAGTSGTLTLNSYNYDTANGTGTLGYQYALITPPTLVIAVTDDFTVFMKDGAGVSTPPKTLAIAIIDDTPITSFDNASVTEDGVNPISGNVFDNDKIGADGAYTSPTGPVTGITNSVSISGTVDGATPLSGFYGGLTIGSNGAYSYLVDNANPVVNALKSGQSLTETCTYAITDKDGDVATATLTITINGANDAPVANDVSYSMQEDGATIVLTPLALDTDGDGDNLTVTRIGNTALTPGTAQDINVTGGIVQVSAGGVMTFAPSPDFNGIVTIPYTISDGQGGTATANIVVSVSTIADIEPDTMATNTNTAISYNPITGTNSATADSFEDPSALISGINGSPINIGDTVNVANGTVSLGSNNILTFTPASNFTSSTTYTYTVTSGGASETATETIVIRPQISINDVTVDESAVVGTATFTVTLSSSSSETIAVDFQTVGITATQGTDFIGANGALTFNPGETSKTITVAINDDVLREGDETFGVNLSNATNATIADNLGSGTITDNESPVSVSSVSNPSAAEGGNLDFEITLSSASTTITSVTINPASGSAIVGTDTGALEVSFDGGLSFQPVAGLTVNVPVSKTSFIVRVPALNDSILESSEAITLSASTDENITPVLGAGVITDGTGLTVSISDAPTVNEGGNLVYTVNLSGTSGSGITIPLTYAGTVIPVLDYSSNPILVTIPAGSITATVIVPTLPDNLVEGNETLLISLGIPNNSNVTVVDGLGSGVVIDDDSFPGAKNDGPIFTQPNTSVGGNILSNDIDADGGVLAVTQFTIVGVGVFSVGANAVIPSVGILVINSAGQFIFTPLSGYHGSVPLVTYTVTDGDNLSTATLSFSDVPDTPPVAIDDGPDKASADGSVKGNLLNNDSDANGNALKVTQFTVAGISGVFSAGTLANIPGIGGLLINADGSYIFTPNAGYVGSVPQVTYIMSDGITTDTAILHFADIPKAANQPVNNGSLIILSNPTPPLFSRLDDVGYSLSPFREPDLDLKWSSEKPYHSSALKLYGNLQEYELYLTGMLPDQLIVELKSYVFYIPFNIFHHSNPSEQLEYEATQFDGSQLPSWLIFDSSLLEFSGTPPKGAPNVEVALKAWDRYGNDAYVSFRVVVYKEHVHNSKSSIKIEYPKTKAVETQHVYGSSGKIGFIEQVGRMGKLTRLVESRALLDSLNELNQRPDS